LGQYRYIVLENGLKVLLHHQKGVSEASAYLIVNSSGDIYDYSSEYEGVPVKGLSKIVTELLYGFDATATGSSEDSDSDSGDDDESTSDTFEGTNRGSLVAGVSEEKKESDTKKHAKNNHEKYVLRKFVDESDIREMSVRSCNIHT